MNLNNNYHIRLVFNSLAIVTILLFSVLTSSAQFTLDDSLQAYYPFNGNALDESGNGHDAVLYGPTLTFDRSGNPNSAYDFDGFNDYIDTETRFDYEYRTVSMWINADDITGTGSNRKVYVNMSDPVLDYGSISGLFEANEILLDPAGGGSAPWIVSQVAINTWYHVVLVRDGAVKRAYLDNIELGQGVSGTVSSISDPYDKLVFGTSRHRTILFFDGTIDDVRVYNRALGICEIEALYNGDTTTTATFSTGPIIGQPQPEQFQTETYSVTQNIGSSYLWAVVGGNVVSGDGTSIVAIQWGSMGAGSIIVVESDSIGCQGEPSQLAIDIQGCLTPFQTGPITGKIQPIEFEVESYSVPVVLGSSFFWTVNAGNIVGGNGTNALSVQWGATGPALVEVIETDSFSCESDTSTLSVTIVGENVGVFDPHPAWTWLIYPNPHNGQFELNITNPKREIIEVSMIDMLGRRIVDLKSHDLLIKEAISLRNFGPGIYLIRLTANNIIQSRKVLFLQ